MTASANLIPEGKEKGGARNRGNSEISCSHVVVC